MVTMLAENPQKQRSPKEKVERKRILQGQEGGTQVELWRLTAPGCKGEKGHHNSDGTVERFKIVKIIYINF